jgi:hypothetical protein
MKSNSLLFALTALLCSCASLPAPTPEHLDAIGVKNGANALDALSNLGHEGFQCQASGAKHENFDCSRMEPAYLGLSTCIVRLNFSASDSNLVEKLFVRNVACAGF